MVFASAHTVLQGVNLPLPIHDLASRPFENAKFS